ncbi:Rieske 2Fe-2S domain-containing protein [Streptomyces sp. NPDC050504]|uniref:Rieske 2Fe-2S domain-containing protein n=1 Tax=Streptomyces sp. NPDC050504 TaxID=3365618 RepID=UPI0037A97DC8
MSRETDWIAAADAADLWEGDILGVEVRGRPVLLVRLLGGDVRAFQGTCPHQGLPLDDADFDPDTDVLTCSGHLWEFAATTGAGVNPLSCRLRRYQARERAGSIDIALDPTSTERA